MNSHSILRCRRTIRLISIPPPPVFAVDLLKTFYYMLTCFIGATIVSILMCCRAFLICTCWCSLQENRPILTFLYVLTNYTWLYEFMMKTKLITNSEPSMSTKIEGKNKKSHILNLWWSETRCMSQMIVRNSYVVWYPSKWARIVVSILIMTVIHISCDIRQIRHGLLLAS